MLGSIPRLHYFVISFCAYVYTGGYSHGYRLTLSIQLSSNMHSPPSSPSLPSGKEPMYHRQLAVKRVERSKANKVVADVIVCRGRDKVSKMYKRLE